MRWWVERMTPRPSSGRSSRHIFLPVESKRAKSAPAPPCLEPQRNNLAIELRSSLPIGSSTRQSTNPHGASLHVSTSLHVGKEKRGTKIRDFGFGPDIYNKRSPSPDPRSLLKTRVGTRARTLVGVRNRVCPGFQVAVNGGSETQSGRGI
jgi:hypothetical protein